MAQISRRRMSGSILAAAFGAMVSSWASGQTRSANPQPMASPNAPQNENVPAGLDGADIPWRNGQRAIPPATWLEIKADARKLLEMTQDFNNRVDQTNTSATLPISLLKEAHKIEKLAKKIQSRMKD